MERIGVPDGISLSGVVCIKHIQCVDLENGVEFLIEGFVRDSFDNIVAVDIRLFTDSPLEEIRLKRKIIPGSMHSFTDEACLMNDHHIELLYPKLKKWTTKDHYIYCEDEEHTMDQRVLGGIAKKIAGRSKKHRHYFDDFDDVTPSRKVKGLWTYGSEKFGLQNVYIYVPHQSTIPLKELAELLHLVDRKLERAGDFKRIICAYGAVNTQKATPGGILRGYSTIDIAQWLTVLTMLTEDKKTTEPLTFRSFLVPYQHAFGQIATTRPNRESPIIVIMQDNKLVTTEKASRAVRALRQNLNWVNYNTGKGWNMEDKSYRPDSIKKEWIPSEALVESIQNRLLNTASISQAFTSDHSVFIELFLDNKEREELPEEPSSKDLYNLINKCFYEPVTTFFTEGNGILRKEEIASRMVHDLVDNQLVSLQDKTGSTSLVEVRQDRLFLDDGRDLFEVTYTTDRNKLPLIIVVAGDLHIEIDFEDTRGSHEQA